MRKAINENPIVQIAIIVVLAIGVGLILFIQLGGGGGGEEPPATDPAATAPATSPTTPTTPTKPTTPDPGTEPEVVEIDPGDLEPGPGLPKEVVTAYENGKTVVLVIADPEVLVDRRLVQEAEKMAKQDKSVALFQVDPVDVSKYSRITIGVAVDRNPVLVVLSPQDVSGEGAPPRAWTHYGFRNLDGVKQTVVDAEFTGPTGSLSP